LGLKELPNGWAVDDGGVALSIKGKMSTREWLEDVIPNLVEESLVNFNVYVITKGSENSQIEEGRGVLVVEVGDSDQAPHQASDNKYYARVGGKSRPIGHRLVTDIYNRRQHPKMVLEAEFKVTRQAKRDAASLLGVESAFVGRREPDIESVIEIQLTARNVGKVLVNYMSCFVWIPKVLAMKYPQLEEHYQIEEVDGTQYVVWSEENTERDITGHAGVGSYPTYGPSWYRPVLPGLAHSWEWTLESDVKGNYLKAYSEDYIRWKIFADNAPPERGVIRIGDAKVSHIDKTKKPRL
jgi:hypothetical protein